MFELTLLLAVLEGLLTPHAFGKVWYMGQTAIAAGPFVAWWIQKSYEAPLSLFTQPKDPRGAIAFPKRRASRRIAA
jgi:hypothetical protein